MKKLMKTFASMLALAMLLSFSALAAAPVVAPVEGVEYVVSDAGNSFEFVEYTNAAIVEGGQYMIYVVEKENGAYLPTESSMLYINQAEAAEDGIISFENVYPKEMKSSAIMISGEGFSAPVVIAEITVASSSVGGDVTDEGDVDTSYRVEAEKAENGKIKVSSSATKGDTVTVTVAPDAGYALAELIITDGKGNKLQVTDQGNGKFTFKMPAGKVNIEAVFEKIEGETENPFTDVAAQDYFYDAVLWAAEKGITNGVSATEFAPNAICNRAQVVTFLWRAAGCPEPEAMTMPFTDVETGSYYHDAVLWAVEKGITNGVSATEFAPDATVTRGQTVTFLWRAENGFVADGENIFTDVEADAYYYNAVLWAVEKGITNGTSATQFAPMSGCTRGQIVTFLYRTFAE